MALTKARRDAIVAEHRTHPKDVGSVYVQVAVLTEEIKLLTAHLLQHKQDYISKRGLYTKVARRRNLLRYLERSDLEGYRGLIKRLDLRH